MINCQVQDIQVLGLNSLVTHVDLLHLPCDAAHIYSVLGEERSGHVYVASNTSLNKS